MVIQMWRYVIVSTRGVPVRRRGLGALAAGLVVLLGGLVIGGSGSDYGSAGPVALSTAGARPAPVAPSASGETAPVAPLAPDDPANAYIARLPHFPPAPAPRRIDHPAGPSASWLSRVPTDQPVAFLTIDDGWSKLPIAPKLLRAAHTPVTLFLSISATRGNPEYFRSLQSAGAVIESHTITHNGMRGRPYPTQQREICGSADQLGEWYGRRPVLFRPPFGEKDATTLVAAHDCGIKAAFFWTETVDKGIVRYQVGNQIRPGDIILMHFRPAFADDFLAALNAIHDAGLTPALLEDYVG